MQILQNQLRPVAATPIFGLKGDLEEMVEIQ